nr:hypothetical protein [Mesorhizobium sp.]
MGTIELHGWGARIEDVEKADRVVFDLDPDEGLDFEAVRAAAFQFRDVLKSLGFTTFPMLMGEKGACDRAPHPSDRVAVSERLRTSPRSSGGSKRSRSLYGRVVESAQKRSHLCGLFAQPAWGDRDHALQRNVPTGRAGAGPITWAEMKTIDAPSHFHVGDAPELKKRAASKSLAGMGSSRPVIAKSVATYRERQQGWIKGFAASA